MSGTKADGLANDTNIHMDASTEGLVDCTWIHLKAQMDASRDGLVAAHGHPGTTIQMDTEADRLAEEPE